MREVNGREPPQRPGIPQRERRRRGDETAPGTKQAAETTCPRCGGKGSLGQVRCPDCQGSGRITAIVGDA